MSVIHIVTRENPYAQIDKRLLADRRLSWRAKGILAYLLSKPSGWKVNVKDVWNNGAEGRNAVQDCLVELAEVGYAKLITVYGDGGKLMGSQWQVMEEPIGGFQPNAEKPKTGKPRNRKSGFRVYSNNEDSLTENQSNNEGSESAPERAEISETVEAEEINRGLVPPPPAEAAAPTHMVTEIQPETPHTRVVTPFVMPTRVSTTIEAEAKISDWITGEGLETVKHRYSTAKERFDPEQAPAIAAHYCSVYTKNPANKERLLKDPVTHFSDGLFSYIKSEQQYSRPKPGPAAQKPLNQPPSALPRSLQSKVG